ncbi:hypothetical protein [Peribacillus glennii]|uniref:Uncharacterized protein n=1 Tax=Peribacillus glennii TaxID=2303991 RepID=A0A372LKD4_9BACI|nr:hypothetical protein [Peribacillus glennii]RFU66666.1 hypothetical protein D0466_00700 [Peribacillus glennii]
MSQETPEKHSNSTVDISWNDSFHSLTQLDNTDIRPDDTEDTNSASSGPPVGPMINPPAGGNRP